MTIQEALTIISQLAENYRGLLKEHQSIQEALKVINDKIKEVSNGIDS